MDIQEYGICKPFSMLLHVCPFTGLFLLERKIHGQPLPGEFYIPFMAPPLTLQQVLSILNNSIFRLFFPDWLSFLMALFFMQRFALGLQQYRNAP